MKPPFINVPLSRSAMSGLLALSFVGACDAGDDVADDGVERAALDRDSLARAIEDAVIEAADFEPPAETFEFTGYIEDEEAAWKRRPSRARTDQLPDLPQGLAAPSTDMVDILTRDGRTYRQRAGTETFAPPA